MKKYLGIFFVFFICCQTFAVDSEIVVDKNDLDITSFDLDDLRRTTSYKSLNLTYQTLSFCSLAFAPLDGTAFAAGACFGMAYQQLKKYFPTKFSSWFATKGLSHRETLGALLFFEEILELKIFDHLIGDSIHYCCAELHKIIDGISLPGASAKPLFANNTSVECELPTCPRFVTSVCGKQFYNQRVSHVITFVFINPEPRDRHDLFFVGCGDANQQYQQFHARVVKPLVEWNREHKDTPVELFVDRSKMSKKTWDNAASMLCASLARRDGQVFMKDLFELSTFSENKRFFADATPIYPKVDFARAMLAFERADPNYPEFPISTAIIYADLDIPPMAKEIIFTASNKKELKKAGLAFIQYVNFGVDETFLPGFFVMTPKINRKLFKKAYIDVVMRAFDRYKVSFEYEYFAYDVFFIWNFARQRSNLEGLVQTWFQTLEESVEQSFLLFIALKDYAGLKPVPTLVIKNFRNLLGDNRRISFSCPPNK